MSAGAIGGANGMPVSDKEWEAYRDHPRLGRDLIARIPRLSGVAEAIRVRYPLVEAAPSHETERPHALILDHDMATADNR